MIFESYRTVLAEVDEVKISLVFTNLIENAIKYNKEGGIVKVTLNADHRYFTVQVEDTGIGISEEELPNIFDKFYKSKLRQNAKGSGLGLSIAREICLKHDGLIKVESEIGKGTSFLFNFPKMEERKT